MIQAIKAIEPPLGGDYSRPQRHPYFSTLIRGSSDHLRTLHAYLVILFTLVLSKIVMDHQEMVIFFFTLPSRTAGVTRRPCSLSLSLSSSEKADNLCSPTTFAWCPIAVRGALMVS